MSEPMTHTQAVRRIGKWLRFTKGCSVVAIELATACHETPDAIGFHGMGASILVECKVSRADLLADRHKSFRHDPESGMGDLRYFALPPGLLREGDDFGDWGVLEIGETRIKVVREGQPQKSCKRSEVKLLMSAIRRLEISTAVFVCEPDAPKEPIV